MSPLLAQSRHELVRRTCPLSGVKQTSPFALHMSAFDPKRTWAVTRPIPSCKLVLVQSLEGGPSSRSTELFQGGTDMLRLFVSAKIFVMVSGLAGLPARAQSASDATSISIRVAQSISPTQQEEQRAAKSVACRKQAKEQKLSGSNRRAFLKKCIRT